MNEQRMNKLAAEIQRQELDCLALVPGANLTYLTGLHFHLGDRPTLAFFFPDRRPALVLPSLELRKVDGLDLDLFPWSDEEGYPGAFQRAGIELELAGKQIGVESYTMRVVEMRLLEEMVRAGRLLAADGVVNTLRICKDPAEVARMRRAAGMIEQALQKTLAHFQPGMTEREIAAQLKIAILEGGAENVSFDPIVSAGPNSANPHAAPGDRPVQSGDFLLFDCGVYFEGYASDLTRTFPVGEMEAEMHTIYEMVRRANAAGRAFARPGVTCAAVDAAVRRVIEEAGYGQYFTHRTGHGLGMQIHEAPYIVAGNERVLQPGMTFTIEPGIYLPGRNGVRIEDDVVVTAGGCESLTGYPRHWNPLA